ncbi:hypothetical protein GUJ93_ZPchr0009g1630 [Zizania palustris]|uniref:Uncharacterized protein n=1 Tax=Zizania palustris TaxID=103762 RepID=A0A8J5RKW3_ZIZPA|nr:hypothetical protein GUJ93_ZPchr0009g1630 [Zizania palustris]
MYGLAKPCHEPCQIVMLWVGPNKIGSSPSSSVGHDVGDRVEETQEEAPAVEEACNHAGPRPKVEPLQRLALGTIDFV